MSGQAQRNIVSLDIIDSEREWNNISNLRSKSILQRQAKPTLKINGVFKIFSRERNSLHKAA